MKKYWMFFLVVLLFCCFCNNVLAYDMNTTHPELTKLIIDKYNTQTSKYKIDEGFNAWIVKGSIDEDLGTRSLNHFFDPIYNRTWTLSGIQYIIPNVTSKEWSQNSVRQANSNLAFLASLAYSNKSVLESDATQTYQRAIYEYIKGNKAKAFYSLGHILHLIEDLTVPAHTRAEPHSNLIVSTYENSAAQLTASDYTQIYNKINYDNLAKRDSLNEYFDSVAVYTNTHFFSDGTILDYATYARPEVIYQDIIETNIEGIKKYYLEAQDPETQEIYRLAVRGNLSWAPHNNTSPLSPYNLKDSLVFRDSWNRLSKKAVLEGAGVIDLFFRDVEKYKNDPNFIKQMETKFGIGYVMKVLGDAVDLIKQMFIGQPDVILNSSTTVLLDTHGVVTTITTQNNSTATQSSTITPNIPTATNKTTATTTKATTTTKKVTTTTKKTTTTTKKTTTTTVKKVTTTTAQPIVRCSFVYGGNSINTSMIFNEIAWMGTKTNASDEWIELKNISGNRINISNWQIVDKNGNIKIAIPNNTWIDSQAFYLLERSDDATIPYLSANLIYTGALVNNNEELQLFDSNCNLIDRVVANPDWPAGNNDLKLTMERGNNLSWHTFSGNCVNNICGTPYAENSVGVDATFSDTNSNGGGTYNNSNNTTTTSTTISSTTTTTNNFDTDTTTSTTSSTTTSTTTKPIDIPIEPIVFSEVQISGETADDEFIELYNPLDHDIDLTGYSIKKLTDNNLEKKTNLVSDDNISGKIIQSHGYFLIVHAKEGSIDKYKGTTSPDLYFNSESYSIVPNNTLILYDSLNREIDRIGWANNEAVDPICEGDCLLNINDFQSFERKAKSSSTKDLMQDGLDKTFGNSFDSNNNIQDFIIRDISEPQNSFSIKEPYTPENISELIIPTPTGFTAVLNPQDKTMDFTWDKLENEDNIEYRVCYSDHPNGCDRYTTYTTNAYMFDDILQKYKMKLDISSFTGEYWYFRIFAHDITQNKQDSNLSDDLVVSIIGPYFINNYFDVIEYTNDENNYIILKGRAKRNFSTQTYCWQGQYNCHYGDIGWAEFFAGTIYNQNKEFIKYTAFLCKTPQEILSNGLNAVCNYEQGKDYSLYLTKYSNFDLDTNNSALLQTSDFDQANQNNFIILRTTVTGNIPAFDPQRHYYTYKEFINEDTTTTTSSTTSTTIPTISSTTTTTDTTQPPDTTTSTSTSSTSTTTSSTTTTTCTTQPPDTTTSTSTTTSTTTTTAPKVYTNPMVDILDFYTDLEGYVRIRVRFLENVIMKWQYGDQAHCYGYGEPRTWFYHFRIWQTSWNSQNLGLYPTKDWTDWTETWNHVQNFMQNQIVDFYVSSNTCGYALMKDNLTTDDWVNFSGVQGSYDSVWDDPSHYMWSGQKSY